MAATVGIVAAACSSAGPGRGCCRSIAENVEIGGVRSIFVECHGEGSPTVLLFAGGGTASDVAGPAAPPPATRRAPRTSHRLVRELANRDAYGCGPPVMTAVVRAMGRLGVPRAQDVWLDTRTSIESYFRSDKV